MTITTEVVSEEGQRKKGWRWRDRKTEEEGGRTEGYCRKVGRDRGSQHGNDEEGEGERDERKKGV